MDLTAALMLWISGQELAKPKRQNNKLSWAMDQFLRSFREK